VIPSLTTERLRLRAFRSEDFEIYAGFLADLEVTRYLTGEPMNRADAWRNLAMVIGHWSLRGFGMWAVERKDDRTLIGRVGLHEPEGWPGIEVGWMLGRDYWGQGYASEAARAAMAYGFLTQGLERLISVIQIENRPSQALAARLGESKGPHHDVIHSGRTFPTDIWSITRADWQRLTTKSA
jgi:RimJ/RimL family protein N-acetyltransferase